MAVISLREKEVNDGVRRGDIRKERQRDRNRKRKTIREIEKRKSMLSHGGCQDNGLKVAKFLDR